MAAVPHGWKHVEQFSRTYRALSARDSRPAGSTGPAISAEYARVAANSVIMSIASTSASTSARSARRPDSISTADGPDADTDRTRRAPAPREPIRAGEIANTSASPFSPYRAAASG